MPKKLFALDVRLVATAYIKADNVEEARNIAKAELVNGIEFSNRYHGLGREAICVDGRSFETLSDNEEDIALSPVMTFMVEPIALTDLSEAHVFEETQL